MAEGGHSYNNNGNSSCPNNLSEQDTVPSTVPEDGPAGAVLQDIVDEVVSQFADQQISVSNNNNNISNNGLDNSSVEDIIKFMLNGSENSLPPVEDVENVDFGNYLPPADAPSVKDSGSGNSTHSLFDESENSCYYYEDGTFDGAASVGTSSGGGGVPEDATHALTMMQILVDENKYLRQVIGKLQRVTALVMSKYRNSMTFMLNELDVYKNDYLEMVKRVKEQGQNYDSKNNALELNAIIAEMKQAMFEAARLDDTTLNLYEERIAQLRFENQGLHKIIKIALDYGGEHRLTYKDKFVQTEDSPNQNNDEEEAEVTVPTSNESMNIYLASNDPEREDDLESYYSADSFNGSVSLPNQEPDGDCEADATGDPESPESVALPALVTTLPKVGDHDKVDFDVEKELNVNVLLDITTK